ncbi:MAG: hypothetical protein ISP82_01745 [Candidatus Poseidoniaceae archaeon]|nr:hypothetical protein [Candidatus Poseidoniaceae archaeon]MBL6896359.1 hypothetical protein [Candidatus Poseidoniaceae archaeon]
MSTNFWDAKVGDEENPPSTLPSVEQDRLSVENKATKPHSDAVLFSNPLVIDVDGNKTELPLALSNELSEQAINLIFKAKEYWMIELACEESFFQMNVQTSEIEHWLDGNIIHQQRGDIGQAMDYLESIISESIPSENSTPTDNIWSQPTANNEISTSQRIVEMRAIDIQQLEQSGPKETHHFPNLASIIVGGGTLFFALISLINGAIFPLLITGFISFIGLAIAFSIHVKIDHYPNDSTFVWYRGQSVDFIYQKQAGDKLQHWEEVSYSTDSEGDTTSTTYYHFRMVDASGGELYSAQGAGGGSFGRNNRAKLTNLLGLPTGNVSRSAGKIQYQDPGSPNFNVEPAKNSFGVLSRFGLFPIIIFLMFGFVIVSDIFLDDDFGTYDYEMPNRWCDESVNYPVTVPINTVSETAMRGYETNRADGTYSNMDLVINGGICTYRYQTGESTAFEFEYELQEVSDIDGISMLVMFHPGGQYVGYSGLEVYTMTNNSSQWVQQIDSHYMYGDYERYASHEDYLDDFWFDRWFRHAFDNTVENVSQVKIVTGHADQMGDRSVSFSGLRVDAAGDYDYPDYRICSGEWDGLFENSTSDMIPWSRSDGEPYHC